MQERFSSGAISGETWRSLAEAACDAAAFTEPDGCTVNEHNASKPAKPPVHNQGCLNKSAFTLGILFSRPFYSWLVPQGGCLRDWLRCRTFGRRDGQSRKKSGISGWEKKYGRTNTSCSKRPF